MDELPVWSHVLAVMTSWSAYQQWHLQIHSTTLQLHSWLMLENISNCTKLVMQKGLFANHQQESCLSSSNFFAWSPVQQLQVWLLSVHAWDSANQFAPWQHWVNYMKCDGCPQILNITPTVVTFLLHEIFMVSCRVSLVYVSIADSHDYCVCTAAGSGIYCMWLLQICMSTVCVCLSGFTCVYYMCLLHACVSTRCKHNVGFRCFSAIQKFAYQHNYISTQLYLHTFAFAHSVESLTHWHVPAIRPKLLCLSVRQLWHTVTAFLG